MLTNSHRYFIGKIQTNNINTYIGTSNAYLSFSRGTWPLLYVSLPRDVVLPSPSDSCQSLPHLLRSSTRSEEQKNIRENIQNNSNQKFNHNLPLYLYKEGLKYLTPRAREPNRKRNSHGMDAKFSSHDFLICI